jgi:large subunit ribosomal protein L22
MAAVETQRKSVRAQAKYVHSSARKARLVTDLIRGRSVPEARTILAFSQRAVAKDVEKVLRSAVANAESRPDLHWNGDDLVIMVAYVDEGPTLKRFRARARGRASSIRKRMCHITLELAPNPRVAAGAATSTAPARAERRPKKSTTAPSHVSKGESPAAADAELPPEESTTEPPQASKEAPAPKDAAVVEKPKASRRKKKTEGSE